MNSQSVEQAITDNESKKKKRPWQEIFFLQFILNCLDVLWPLSVICLINLDSSWSVLNIASHSLEQGRGGLFKHDPQSVCLLLAGWEGLRGERGSLWFLNGFLSAVQGAWACKLRCFLQFCWPPWTSLQEFSSLLLVASQQRSLAGFHSTLAFRNKSSASEEPVRASWFPCERWKAFYVCVFQLSLWPVTRSCGISAKEHHVIGTVKKKYDKSNKTTWSIRIRFTSFFLF